MSVICHTALTSKGRAMFMSPTHILPNNSKERESYQTLSIEFNKGNMIAITCWCICKLIMCIVTLEKECHDQLTNAIHNSMKLEQKKKWINTWSENQDLQPPTVTCRGIISGLAKLGIGPPFWAGLSSSATPTASSHWGRLTGWFWFSSGFLTQASCTGFSTFLVFGFDFPRFSSALVIPLDWSLGWDFFTAFLEATLSSLPFVWVLLVETFCSWFKDGLTLEPSPSEGLFVAATLLLCLPSFGDIARVVGIYDNYKRY